MKIPIRLVSVPLRCWRWPALTACVAPQPVYQTSRYPYQPALPGAATAGLRRVRAGRQHRGDAQPDRGRRPPAAAVPWPAAWWAACWATSSAMAAAAPRPRRWAWSAARCWATASRPTATAPRVYESYRVSIQTDNGAYRAFDVPSPATCASVTGCASTTAGRFPACERACIATKKAGQKPGLFCCMAVAQCSVSLPGVTVGTLKKPVPAVPRPISSSVASRTDRTVRSSRSAMPASGWLPSSTTCSG